jgi:hypothetical protein
LITDIRGLLQARGLDAIVHHDVEYPLTMSGGELE